MGGTSPDNKPFVRSAETKGKGQRYKLTSAFSNAGRGLFEAVCSERNLRIDACMAVVAIALGFGLRIDTPSWLAVIVCIGMMFALETVNTAIEAVVDAVIAAHPDEVARYKDGNQKLIGFFVGQCMKEMRGQGNPKLINQLLAQKLAE